MFMQHNWISVESPRNIVYIVLGSAYVQIRFYVSLNEISHSYFCSFIMRAINDADFIANVCITKSWLNVRINWKKMDLISWQLICHHYPLASQSEQRWVIQGYTDEQLIQRDAIQGLALLTQIRGEPIAHSWQAYN